MPVGPLRRIVDLALRIDADRAHVLHWLTRTKLSEFGGQTPVDLVVAEQGGVVEEMLLAILAGQAGEGKAGTPPGGGLPGFSESPA
ncbi:MAG: hypothetical protein REI09_08320 [Candidatus Dactylopiibacterium sp.]|nr:hypothetical protein [Candidatus Dactylopiibacterium sp.]